MIQSIKHAGLKLLYERGSARKLTAAQVPKIKRVLTALEAARKAEDMDLPGLGLHPLRGDLAGTWSVTITGNWRVTFRIVDGDVYDVNLVDYH